MGRNIDGRDVSTRVSPRGLAPATPSRSTSAASSTATAPTSDAPSTSASRTTSTSRCHAIVIAADAAGAAAAVPGVTAAEVDRATRAVIEEAGYGEWYRHRTGHCIGLDTHERPFLSVEDETVLEPGMTFTIEPSIF